MDDRVRRLQAGGDDYLTKPFAFSEMLARVQALIRRVHTGRRAVQAHCRRSGARSVGAIGERGRETIELQPREFALLEYLMRNAGRPVTKAMILEHIWDYSFDPQTNVVDVLVHRLRGRSIPTKHGCTLFAGWGMSSDLIRHLTRSAAVRLSLWFAVIFIVGVAGLFGLLYYLLSATIDRGDRAVLQSYLKDYADVYQSQGLGALRNRVYEQNAPPAEKSLFVRLASAKNDLTFAKVPDDWISFGQVTGLGRLPARREHHAESRVMPSGTFCSIPRCCPMAR